MVDKDTSILQQTEEQIIYLDPMLHVRKRPGMYVGGTDIRALHHLIYEVVDNAIDEALAGRCDHIMITLHEGNAVSVTDNGGGIPVGLNKELGISTLEGVMTKIGMGGKFGGGAYKVSGGLHGVGVSAVNALSTEFISTVYREGHVWEQRYKTGVPTTQVTKIREMEPGEPTGTVQRFIPDFTVMDHNDFSFATLLQRFREMAFVTRRVTITLRDERVQPIPAETTFYFEGGLQSFVRYLNRNRRALHEPVFAEREIEFTPEDKTKKTYAVGVEVSFQYTDSSNVTELAFANTINTPDGGSHLTGLRSAITNVINRYARKAGFLKEKDMNFSGTDTLEGLTAVVSIKHPDPQFESQTKVKLLNAEVQGAVSQVVSEAFAEFLELNPRDARKIVDKCMTSQRAREAARKARELVRSGPSLLESSTLPGKLADCSSHGAEAEIYIVEGDSAGGCFSGDTRVMLADGRALSFEELVAEQAEGKEHFCYTVRRDETVGLERVINPRITKRNAEVIRVTLDNGEVITCTPDHRFMLRDGSYKAAAELTPDESLMPYYALEALTYNHRIVSIERVEERIDVYDIEVPNTHNFALASGVFVHNSAKQGRDRHFQAILPLRGKILNTERARLDKILDNNEIKSLISALGTGISDDFKVENIRYGRVIIMSVAGDEPTLVMDDAGQTEFVRIGDFIDDCFEGRREADRYQVMTFDLQTHATRFRPLKAVIRHPHQEAMYKITTRYNRSVKVTTSHSVFVFEDGQVKLKKGNEIKPGDLLMASRRLPRPSSSPTHIDLLTTLYESGLTDALYVRGEDVRRVAAQRTLTKVTRPDLWNEPRVSLSTEGWQLLLNHRQEQGLSQKRVAESIGVKQPITISHWERGFNRPILSQFMGYLQTIAWDDNLEYDLIPSKIDERLTQDDSSRNARWREISAYKLLKDFTDDELEQLGAEIEIVPQAHEDKAFGRYLPITRDLLWFLGWYVAEGTLSAHQVSINLGKKDERFIPEISAAIESVFGETPRRYNDPDSQGIKFYFHSVAAARLLRAWGLDKPAHEKKLPDVIFSLPEVLQWAFLEGYFLGDGTTAGGNISFTTNSPFLKDGLLYLLGQLGIVASLSHHEPSSNELIQTRHSYYTITICGKEQLETSREIWHRHNNAPRVEAHISRPTRRALLCVPISPDLIGLEVISAEEVDPVGEYVYDFSVENDENFICGVGGLCAHNTDADVDGSHIRTLLLTFFFRHMQPIIQEGHLYIAQPPIYRLQNGKDVEYVYNEAGLNEAELLNKALKKYKQPDKVRVNRYKGLGEMNPDQLWDTTMDPGQRTLLQVTIDDAAEADRVFDMLMGSSVPPRRRFIQTHARNVRNLDV
jgi:DNA gyrase subunit B